MHHWVPAWSRLGLAEDAGFGLHFAVVPERSILEIRRRKMRVLVRVPERYAEKTTPCQLFSEKTRAGNEHHPQPSSCNERFHDTSRSNIPMSVCTRCPIPREAPPRARNYYSSCFAAEPRPSRESVPANERDMSTGRHLSGNRSICCDSTVLTRNLRVK